MSDPTYKKLDSTIVERELGLELESHDSHTFLLGSKESPQGRHLGIYSVMVLYISRVVGSGIFATGSVIFESCGRSPLMFALAWAISYTVAICGLYIYLELGSLIPRSGGTKVFLELIFNKPRMLMTVIFSVYSVAFGFCISSPLVFGEYFLRTFDLAVTGLRTRALAIGFVTLTCMFHAVSTRHGVMMQNVLGVMKIGLLVVLLLTGIWVIGFPTSMTGVENTLTWERFHQAEKPVTIASFSNAIIVSSFTLAGWNMGHISSNEVKDPVRTYKIAGPLSMLLILLGYTAINVCYVSVLTPTEFAESGNLSGSVLFEKVYGVHFGKRFLTFSVAMCTASNIFVVIYSVSRMSQEVFREGVLPFSVFMASNKPFGTPLRSICLCLFLSVTILVLAPSGGVYGYIVSIEGYPVQLYTLFTALGLIILRRRYPETKAPIRASVIGAGLVVIIMAYVLVSPFCGGNPNPKGTESWISYPLVSITLIFLYVLYWLVMFKLMPWIGRYKLVSETLELDDGLTIKKWVQVPQSYFG
ncbi:hypothetical protein CANTEDRAFT_114011 [Yamadazyma tenuis ATCC 10573]|uniref:Amino acid transporter n=1 Tax=Candida tenuis (strain ATCC 10573 / BCRC 21748 / CBS 615 / JCM 9827 / NBRC 10315 / NRRL Y-1498 / VKM Y-70) TaxID=590646 RepID=G3B4L6_CANTC|nr:uncharacterized protein CANTEDRAFT_114011 [Yamadazyma tenuis ATCC 10573]EGV64308.1 hypothetical protein CANTEDRAFT_114011 [Yamadazyma tenuis ATCC 10573]